MTDERRFDDLLREDAAALPPPAAGEINPWSMAMTRVLWGLGLITITLNFLYLDVILPAVGGLLLVLGFCTLRRENTPLRWCYILSLASLAVRGACIVLAALPVETGLAPAYVNIALLQVLYVCLWRGMVGVSRAAGEEKPAATAAGAMAVFYAVLTVLALIGVEGWLLVLPMLVLYILLLRSMVRLSRSLADTGYAITAAPVRLPDAAVLWGGLGVLLAAVLLAMFLGQRYPMDWHARDDAPQDETIRQQLLAKGFPSYVLDDLTAEEVSRMAGAVRVYRQVERLYSDTDHRTITTTHYMSDPDRPLVYDHTITDVDGEGERHYTYVYRVYDYSGNTAKVTGYEAVISLTVSDLPIDGLDELLARSVQEGVNTIQSITYMASNYDESYKQALAKAVETAYEKAEVLASASGRNVGKAVKITETSGYSEARYEDNARTGMYSATAKQELMADTASISPGQIEVNASIVIEYELY